MNSAKYAFRQRPPHPVLFQSRPLHNPAQLKRWEFKDETIYLFSDKYAKHGDKMPFHDWEVGKVFEILGLTRSMK